MPHDNQGRIFISNGMGIDVYGDIAHVLGRNTGDVGQLCGDLDANGNRLIPPRIKKWAKYKPFGYASWGFAIDNTKTSPDLRQPARYSALVNANFGLRSNYSRVFGTYTGSGPASGTFLETLVNGTEQWEYLPPTGAASQPFRVLDFDGYLHTAKSPLPLAAQRSSGWPLAPGVGLANIVLNEGPGGTLYEIGLSELRADSIGTSSLSLFYPGVLLWHRDRQNLFECHYATGQQAMSEIDPQEGIKIPIYSLTAGRWYARSFLSSVIITQDTPPNPNSYYFISCDDPGQEYSFYESGGVIEVIVSVKVLTEQSTGTTKADVTFVNNSGDTGYVSNARLTVMDTLDGTVIPLDSLNGSYQSLGSKDYNNNNIGVFSRGETAIVTATVSGISGQTTISVQTIIT